MKKTHIVREPFVSSVLGPMAFGAFIFENTLPYLTDEELEFVDEITHSTDYDLFNYGLIFHSKEIEFPKTIPDETYDEMVCRMLEEQKQCGQPDCPCNDN